MAKLPPSVFCARSMTLGAVLMLSCMYVGKYVIAPLFEDLSTPTEEQTINLVQSALSSDSIFTPDPQQLLLTGAEAMVDSLNDPYADFISPQEVRAFKEESTGRYTGIGVLLNSNWQIIYPLPNSDTAQQGVVTGDTILEINGEDVAHLDINESASLLTGRLGTSVHLKLRRVNSDIFECDITRQRVPSITISDERIIDDEHGIAHLSVKSFASTTPDELTAALQRLDALGMKALILDLRFNLGGQLNDAISLVSHFLQGEVVCRLRPHNGEEYLKYADLGLSTHADLPLIVLVNELSASGAEVVAAALRDNKRAKLMGVRTYGKGVFQKVLSFRNPNFAVKFTAGYYLTPNGDMIESYIGDDQQARGLVPDFLLDKQSDATSSTIKAWANRARVPAIYAAAVAELFPEYVQLEPPKDSWLDAAAKQLISEINQ
ncbi:MAG TPA: hypothetical protein EYN86_06340 [Planctomycetes bacterium]|nr:hypothetical protein [Planctomycetota bacterium]